MSSSIFADTDPNESEQVPDIDTEPNSNFVEPNPDHVTASKNSPRPYISGRITPPSSTYSKQSTSILGAEPLKDTLKTGSKQGKETLTLMISDDIAALTTQKSR